MKQRVALFFLDSDLKNKQKMLCISKKSYNNHKQVINKCPLLMYNSKKKQKG